MSRSMIYIGNITQQGINCINPLQAVTLLTYAGNTTDEAGLVTNSYNQTVYQARIQPVSDSLVFKMQLEFGYTYRRFYILLDSGSTVNRNTGTTGDYFYYDGDYWRIMRVEEEFKTNWGNYVAMQTNQIPGILL